MTRVREASLILTVLNEERSLPDFLETLSSQTDLPSEIVIVDGGSNDRTADFFRSWEAPSGCTVRVHVLVGANISEGRNEAVRRASHDRILVTDAGTTVHPEWAGRMLDAFEGADAPDVVSGFFEPRGGSFVERTIAFTVTPPISEIDGSTFLPSSRSLGFTRAAWEAADGYPEWLDYCEDLLFDMRLKKLDMTFRFVPKAIVSWSARPTIRGFMKQYYRYARGDGKAGLWAKRHAARYSAYVAGVVLVAVSFVQPWALVPLALGAVVYMQKFWRRIWAGRRHFGSWIAPALAFSTAVVVAGDLAKMAGYPVGLAWAAKRADSVRGTLG